MRTRLLAIVALVGLSACSNMPEVTRTGKVQNVVIREDVLPQEVTVNAGDEVRWMNQRTGKVRVEFIDPIQNQISCNNGFHALMGLGNDNTAHLSKDESASLCFNQVGSKRYVVRMASTTPGGERNLRGTVNVK